MAARHVDVGGSDTCRISASVTHADYETEKVLPDALHALVDEADSLERRPAVRLPAPSALEPEQAMLPREAFFAPVEHVPAERAAGRIAAELISPTRPGYRWWLPARCSPTRSSTTCAAASSTGSPSPTPPTPRWTLRVVSRT